MPAARQSRRFTFIIALALLLLGASAADARTWPDSATSSGESAGLDQSRPQLETGLLPMRAVVTPADDGGSNAEPLGGSVWPVIAADLDGDGDDEVLLSQGVHPRSFYLLLDETGIILRRELEPGLHFSAPFSGDFSPDPGDEILMQVQQAGGQSQRAFVLELLGGMDRLWARDFGERPIEIMGLVQADADPLLEVALSEETEEGMVVRVIDGADGAERTIGFFTLSEADFVAEQVLLTDGAGGAADEAIFVARLNSEWPPAYYAERRRLDDGSLTWASIIPSTQELSFVHSSDHTGDGRRDALAETEDGVSSYGVFDAATLRIVWMKPHVDFALETGSGRDYPFAVGDANGDGADEVCWNTFSYMWSDTSNWQSSTSHARCESGKTGDLLWEAERSAETETEDARAWSWLDSSSDLNADGVADPVIHAGVDCPDVGSESSCGLEHQPTLGLSGRDATIIWQHDGRYFPYSLSNYDLDGLPGHDPVDRFFAENYEDQEARFRVINGLDLSPSWGGIIDTDGIPAYAGGFLPADLDGDGASEVVVSAYAYELVSGDISCQEGCEFQQHAYAGVFDPASGRLWQDEL